MGKRAFMGHRWAAYLLLVRWWIGAKTTEEKR
jgi:hypothetical protein